MAGKGDETTQAIDRLYGLAFDEFTAARDRLAKELRRDGDADGAAAVKRLRKPSVAAWALNRVRRSHPAESDELLAAGERLRQSQEGLLSGGDREEFQQAVAEERRLVGRLAELAAGELSSAGRAPTAAVQEKLRSTLHAVAVDDEAREGFEAGRLVGDHEASGLGPLGGGDALPTRSRAPAATRRARERKPPRPRAAAPAGRAAEPAADARERRAEAKAAAAHEKKVSRLEERIEKARARARERGREAAEAESARRDAREAATRAAAALKRAEAGEERARERAVEADEFVAGLEAELQDLRESAR